MSDKNVAVACQGGGSHTAFTSGVLTELIGDLPEGYELTSLSGSSGGAACATLAWYGTLHPDEDPEELLSSFWRDISATTPMHMLTNNVIKLGVQMERAGFPIPTISPSKSPSSQWAKGELRRIIESHVDFSEVPSLLDGEEPGLFLSAIDVLSGETELFREDDLYSDAILASSAEPHIFEAVEIEGRHYWDGLFARNPPVSAFMDHGDVPDPDEIWLIRINPQRRDEVPQTPEGINDRRNELSGNLSLNSELRHLEKVNRWIEKGYLPDRYTHTEIREIRFRDCRDLDWRTKLDRSPSFIQGLVECGEKEGKEFRDSLPETD